jgi:hypothetical protein
MQSSDPFFVVKDKARTLLEETSESFEAWEASPINTNTRQYILKTHVELRRQTQTALTYVRDLEAVLGVVSKSRAKFPNISDAELESRAEFVATIKAASKELSTNITSTKSKARLNQAKNTIDKVGLFTGDMSGPPTPSGARMSLLNDRKIQQVEKEALEDEVLTDMGSIIGRLGGVAQDMGSSLKQQTGGLKTMQENVTVAQSRMELANIKMDKMLGTSQAGRYWLILFLVITMCVLMLIIIWG